MIKKVSIILAVVIMLSGMTACGANAGQDTTDGVRDGQFDNWADIQGETMESEDRSEAEKEKAEGKDRSNVEDEATGSADKSDVENETVGSVNEANVRNEAVGPEGEAAVKEAVESENEFVDEKTGEQTEMKMNVQIGDYNFTATLESNTAVDELVDMMKEGPVTIDMDDYSGFEKVGSLGRSLTTSNSQTTTTAGDIVLYNGSNIVMFYGRNSWSYTRIGKIDDLTDWKKALGEGSITAVFTIAE